MRNSRCVCAKCGRAFLWTHEEKITALDGTRVQDMFDTKKFKTATDGMRPPRFCRVCRGAKKG